MITQSVRHALFDFAIACALVILFVPLAGITKADPVQDAMASAAVTSDKPAHDPKLWDFIRVGTNFAEEPKWDARPGKADVQIHGSRIVIRAYYEPDAAQQLKKNAEPNVVITGTVAANGVISAKCIFVATDASPVKLTGHYVTRTGEEIWGGRHKQVTLKELVFPRLPNAEFWGFLGRDVADK